MKILTLLFYILPFIAFTQDNLLQELEKDTSHPLYTSAAFKSSRLINGHTVETHGKGDLEFIFQHRFGLINGGAYELFGLDEAFVRLGLDYGLTDDVSFSIGRNSVDKTMDGYAKYKVLRQSLATNRMPITLTLLGGVAYRLSPKKEDFPTVKNSDRLAYVGQILLARKFTSALSLQLMPTLISKNSVNKPLETNNSFACGFGGRLKVSPSIALTSEYYYRFNPPDNTLLSQAGALKKYDALGFGIDIETGGHIFQLLITNTNTLTERAFVTETNGNIFDGELHFGFNVSRSFQLGKRNK
jgi:hypothetical protein